MIGSVAATIPGGHWINGACCREAQLRPLTGADQAFLLEQGGSLLPAQWTTEVLARCVTRLSSGEPVTRDTMRALTVGDREALLLHLRRLTAGDRMQCVLACPACGEKLDLELKATDLLVPACGEPQERHETWVRAGDAACRIVFRLPTGADQEAAASLARTDVDAAADLLLHRCVESVVDADGSPVQELPAAVREQLPARMAELDAQAELTLRLTCPACSGMFTTIFDVASFLFQEIQADLRHLDHEVHLLAYHYHWSPSDILGLSTRQRRRYLELLDAELARGAGR
jgi:predicted RNA-binding Zn-ribbon protein involved in translation (DUF1610 family)